jgi:DNA anti-recombination protein RmuC
MGKAKLSRKERAVIELMEVVRELKLEAGAKHQDIAALEAELEKFGAQYDVYIQTLRHQRQDLAERVQRCRFLIQHQEDPEPPPQEAQPPSLPPEPEPTPQEPPEIPSAVEPIESSDDPVERKRKQVRTFFAQFWHPDKKWRGACPDLDLMHRLNAAFKDTADVTDLLVAIPWHDVWRRPGDNEPIGMQWARLMDWQEALERADERLDQALSRLQQHEFYPLLLEKQAADARGEDYFARLATRERDEIKRLKDTLATLEAQLDSLERREAKEQGS